MTPLPPLTETFALYRPRPRHPDWGALAAEARAIAAEVGPGLEPPRAGRAERRRRRRGQLTALRNYLRNRRLERRGRHDLRPLYFIWTLLRTCNFDCTYCDDHRGAKYPALPTEGTLDTAGARRLLEIMRTGTSSVYFAGGEPTLRKDLPLLTRAARDLDYYPIIINTNGSTVDRRLRDPAWRTWLADTDVIVVSLDGLEVSALRQMWSYKRAHEVLRNLLVLRELARAQRFKLMVNCVIQPGQLDHARDVLDLANDLGIWFCPVPVNVGPSVHAGLAADPAYDALVELILARKRAGYRITGSLRMNQRLLRSAPLDCRNTLKPHVDADGALLWPCKAAIAVPPARIDVLDFADVDALYAHARRAIDPDRFQDRCGARCNWAQNYSTDAYVDGLRHPTRLLADVGELLRGT
ncbi:MAG: radical SAM protein [Kofleriaceae bacterium]|nr:radical SAM protein [Kofleriaceae bacterium]MCL4224980.1 radical SAM protein [Myxococcales bacterium]